MHIILRIEGISYNIPHWTHSGYCSHGRAAAHIRLWLSLWSGDRPQGAREHTGQSQSQNAGAHWTLGSTPVAISLPSHSQTRQRQPGRLSVVTYGRHIHRPWSQRTSSRRLHKHGDSLRCAENYVARRNSRCHESGSNAAAAIAPDSRRPLDWWLRWAAPIRTRVHGAVNLWRDNPTWNTDCHSKVAATARHRLGTWRSPGNCENESSSTQRSILPWYRPHGRTNSETMYSLSS